MCVRSEALALRVRRSLWVSFRCGDGGRGLYGNQKNGCPSLNSASLEMEARLRCELAPGHRREEGEKPDNGAGSDDQPHRRSLEAL